MKQRRLLVCTPYRYYESANGVEPQFYYLYKIPEAMGWTVDFFDYMTAYKIDPEQMRRQFLALLKGGAYHATFIATHKDEFDLDTLKAAKRLTNTFAWNSDDEWRWADYSSHLVTAYTFMVTNSPTIFNEHKNSHKNLLHAQWACTGFWNGMKKKKDIDFSFVGQVYGTRVDQLEAIKTKTNILVYGKGSGKVAPNTAAVTANHPFREWIKRRLMRYIDFPIDDAISFEAVNELWNRSKISFTPLDSSQGGVRQIKSRIFDMGLSGTLMLAHQSPNLDSYYEPYKEYVPFETIDECVEKANYYLKHETERRKIANAYAKRTENDHMWSDRIANVIKASRI